MNKTLMAAISVLAMSSAIAGDTTFLMPAQDSAPVTVCATLEKAANPQPTDVLGSFPLNAAGTVMVFTRDNARSLVSNIGRAIAHNRSVFGKGKGECHAR